MYTQKIEIASIGSSTFTDITKYLKPDGFVWKRIDVDLVGRVRQSGKKKTVRIREKYGAELSFSPLKDADLATVLPLISAKHVQLKYVNPETHTTDTRTMVVTRNQVPFYIQSGSAYWQSFSIKLEEE